MRHARAMTVGCKPTCTSKSAFRLTGDARPRFFEFFDELCSRSGGDASEAMTVGCKPTTFRCLALHFVIARPSGVWAYIAEGKTPQVVTMRAWPVARSIFDAPLGAM